jgi:hypothetical protein
MADDFFNFGNNVGDNYGTVNQYNASEPNRKPFRELPKFEKFAVLGGFVTALLIAFLGAWGFYAQWQPLLANGCGPGGLEAHFNTTFPKLWTAVTLAAGYGYCNLRIYLP